MVQDDQRPAALAARLRTAVASRLSRSPEPAPGTLPELTGWSHAPDRSVQPRPRQVAILVYRGVSSSEVELVGEALARPLEAEVRLVASEPGPVVAVEPARSIWAEPLDAVTSPDALIVPGGLGWRREAARPDLADWLQQATAGARGVLAVSTGSLLLASVGLLDGQEATGHWLASDLLAGLGARPSSARVVRTHLLVTASGAWAGVDAAEELAKQIRFGPR